MDKKQYGTEIDSLRAQTRHWRVIAFSAGAGFLLMASATFALIGNVRVVVAPPVVNKTFWVDHDNASPEYVEQMALFFIRLMLDVTPGNVEDQYKTLKAYVDSEIYGAVQTDLAVNADYIKKNAISQVFFPSGELKVNGSEATVSGRVVRFVGEKKTSDAAKKYRIRLVLKNGKVVVNRFQELGNDGNPIEEKSK